jgi:hypothetical protein
MENLPKENASDVVHSLTKGALGALPIVGGLASEIFGLVVTPSLEKRRVEWLNNLASELEKLKEAEKVDFKELSNNQDFLDVIIKTTQEALKTSNSKKIDALKNAVLNTAVNKNPESAKCQIFLNHIETFTEWHIRILELIQNPTEVLNNRGADSGTFTARSIFRLITAAYPELEDQLEFVTTIWRDLENAGFHNTGEIQNMMSLDGVLSERISSFGGEFLNFISE